ncbi:hypothetical protein C8R47DRAFT_1230114 [Mycena vitilis]|nr:hypothetical protein C8R47DRAFT_1230114 [Mycena vitilis]
MTQQLEPLPRSGNSVDRIQAASNLQWARYRLRQSPQVRPGSLVAPQTVYTGRTMQHNGCPGMLNGHAEAMFAAAPVDDRTCALEATQAEIGRQRRAGQFKMTINRQIEHAPAPAINTPRTTGRPFPVPCLAPIPFLSVPTEAPRPTADPHAETGAPRQAFGSCTQSEAPRPFYLTHPVNVPPRFNTRGLPRLGPEAVTGHRVLLAPCLSTATTSEGQPKRIDTPAPPLRLHAEFPALMKEPAEVSPSDASMASVSPKEPDSPTLKASEVGDSNGETGSRADDVKMC